MTSSNARKTLPETRKITMNVRIKSNSLALQKLSGAGMLILAAAASIGGEASAAFVIAPMAFAAVFSKRKLMDFNIFGAKR